MPVVKQHERGAPVAEIIRKLGIAEVTFYRWKKQRGGPKSAEIRELMQHIEAGTTLKRLVADLCFDKTILQDIASRK